MARATETVAPLVARQAPKVEEIPEDRRGRLATVLAIVGILMAVFQFLVQFYDLVTRPLAPLLGALPYIVAGLLVAGVGFGVYAAVRARSPSPSPVCARQHAAGAPGGAQLGRVACLRCAAPAGGVPDPGQRV